MYDLLDVVERLTSQKKVIRIEPIGDNHISVSVEKDNIRQREIIDPALMRKFLGDPHELLINEIIRADDHLNFALEKRKKHV